MRFFRYTLLLLIIFTSVLHAQSKSDPFKGKFAVAKTNTPVLNTKDFKAVFGGERGNKIKTDKQGFIRELEFIAPEKSVFEILASYKEDDYFIFKVKTNEYPTNTTLFIDSRFVEVKVQRPDERKKPDFTVEMVQDALESLEGYPYMWGGNFAEGIPELLKYYPPEVELSDSEEFLWCLKGVDCSGLLYQATGGKTPRNSSALIHFGEPVEIEDKDIDEIIDILKPLDLIGWNGHVMIVLDDKFIIESSPSKGVHKTEIKKRLQWLLKERTPVNDWDSSSGNRFVVRRWIDTYK